MKIYDQLLRSGQLQSNPEQLLLAQKLETISKSLMAHPSSLQRGLYITGSVGTGKSILMDLFHNQLGNQISRRLHFHEFMSQVQQRLHKSRRALHYKGDPLPDLGRNIAKERKVLCFDEFQVSDIADAMILQRLFGGIFAGGGVMVATSNRLPKQLYENGINRQLFLPFIDTLYQHCDIFEMRNHYDYRMQAVPSSIISCYLSSEPFGAALQSASNGKVLQTMKLPFLGNRSVTVQGVNITPTLRVYSSSMDVLCMDNLGASDYEVICKNAKFIFIKNVKTIDDLDIARRFITLIDVAYERKTKLVLLSSCPLDTLFLSISGGSRKALVNEIKILGEGGSSSSNSTTTFGNGVEWSGTGLSVSMVDGGAGETDVKFAISRAISRLFEMASWNYKFNY